MQTTAIQIRNNSALKQASIRFKSNSASSLSTLMGGDPIRNWQVTVKGMQDLEPNNLKQFEGTYPIISGHPSDISASLALLLKNVVPNPVIYFRPITPNILEAEKAKRPAPPSDVVIKFDTALQGSSFEQAQQVNEFLLFRKPTYFQLSSFIPVAENAGQVKLNFDYVA